MKKKLLFIVAVIVLMSGYMPSALIAQEKTTPKKDVALQMYSLRDKFAKYTDADGNFRPDYVEVIKEIAAMGFTAVEAANYNNGKFYNRTPKEFKADIESTGMRVLSSHATKPLTEQELASGDFSESMKWWDQCIAAHKAAGMKYIVTPWMEVPKTIKDLKTYCLYFNEIGKRCKENGLSYGYHNHAHEFQKIENKEMMYDYMLENTNPKYVFFEMDVYWVVRGQNSPVDYFNKYPGRFTMLHIKDNKEVGQSGMVGFDAIFNNTKTAGVKHIILEVEQYNYAPEKSVEISLDYLLKSSFVKASYTNN